MGQPKTLFPIMAVIYGRNAAKIKEFIDDTQSCTSCNTFGLKVKVFKQYHHIWFIPLFPFGKKVVDARCNQCLAPILTESLKKEYAQKARTPLYLYSFTFIICGFVAWGIYGDRKREKDTSLWVANPKQGDVFAIQQKQSDSVDYYFLRVASIQGDTVMFYHNNLVYVGYASEFNSDDYFVKSAQLYYTKKELKQLLEKGEIDYVDRDYGDDSGFNRLK